MDNSTSNGQYVTFSLADEMFAADVFKVREILEVPDMTIVPGMPAYMRGVINIRGAVVPVIDLKLKFGMGETLNTVNTAVVVTEMESDDGNQLMGVLVDSTHQVISLEDNMIEEPPKIGLFLDNRFLKGMGRIEDGKFVIILDMDKVLSETEIEQIDHASEIQESAVGKE